MSDQPQHSRAESLQPLPALLALLLPGLGHFYLGHRLRAAYVALGILGLFLGGLLVGGIGSVDSGGGYINRVRGWQGQTPLDFRPKVDPIWFLFNMPLGPLAFATDLNHQFNYKVREQNIIRPASPHEIRDPKSRLPITVRDQITGAPLSFTDSITNQLRLSTPSDRPPYTRAIGRLAEIGTLMCTLAGMLNLIAIIDCLWHRSRSDVRASLQAPGGAK